MKIKILALSIVLLVAGTVAQASWFSDLFSGEKNTGATTFPSYQVGNNPVNGYYLKTNGTVSTWAAVVGGSGGSDVNWVFTNNSLLYPATTTNSVVIGNSATTSLVQFEVRGTGKALIPYATTTSLAITGLGTPAGAFLAVNANGSVIATTTPTGGVGVESDPIWVAASSNYLLTANAFTQAIASTTFQPLEATLTDIADGTITENLVNTANPWADNEVADDITASNYILTTSFNNLFDNRLSASSSVSGIITLPNLSILKAQVSDFGSYEAPLTFNYPLSRATNAISLSDMATGTIVCDGSVSCDAGSFVIGNNLTITGSAIAGSGGAIATSSNLTAGLLIQSTAWNTIANIATSSLRLEADSFASPNISQWTNDSGYWNLSSSTIPVSKGGTSSTTLTGILKGAGTSQVATAINGTDYTLLTAQSCTNQVITALTAVGGSTCSSVSNAMLTNSTISGVALGSNLAALTNDATLNGSSYNGSGAISDWGLNLANPNTWTAHQIFSSQFATKASTTNATTTTLHITSLGTPAGSFLAIDANGYVIATTTATIPQLSITQSQISDFGSYVSTADWSTHEDYPPGCGVGYYVNAVGDTLTCEALTGGGTVNAGNTGQIAYYPGNSNLVAGTSSVMVATDQTVTLGTGAEVMRLYGGNMGVGTSTPYSKLSVWGSGNLLEITDTASSTVFKVSDAGVKIGAYTFPLTDGDSGQVLKTDGSGNLTWGADNSGTGGGGASAWVAIANGIYNATSTDTVMIASTTITNVENEFEVTGQALFYGTDTATSSFIGNLNLTNQAQDHGCYFRFAATSSLNCY